MKVRRLDTRDAEFEASFAALIRIDSDFDREAERVANSIVDDVKRRGDAALLEYTKRFDQVDAKSVADLAIAPREMQSALASLAASERDALETAARRIRAFHERQLTASWSYIEEDGTELGQRIDALQSVGLYVPGGLAAYPSSLLMNALPAQVAGVDSLTMVVPTPGGARNPLVLAAAALAGVSKAYAIGGAQAIAALAYGTETIAAVDKIVGPGNAYVAAAKRRVFGMVGIDMIAGPSEILVICDGQTDPDWIALDLFSQAEHDESAQAILLTPDAEFIEQVQRSIDRLLPSMPRRAIIERSLHDKGALILTRSLDEACEIANRVAPEHLELSTEDPDRWSARIRHAGALFLGRHTSEAIGDYCAGPNHVLPTARSARFSSALGVYDFQKRTSIVRVSRPAHERSGAWPRHWRAANDFRGTRRAPNAGLRDMGADDPLDRLGPRPDLSVIRDDVRAITAYAVPSAVGFVKLDAMENPFALPEQLQQQLGERLRRQALNRYPLSDPRGFKERLAKAIGLPYGMQLMLGNGSDELIHLVIQACAKPDAAVLSPAPSFVMYELSARFNRCRYVGVPLNDNFSLDTDRMLKAIAEHRPAVVFIAYPNNPTGNLFDRAAIEAIVRAAPGIVVLDEAYLPFAQDTWMPQLKRTPNLLVLRTMSKLGLAGIRLGYLAGAGDWIAQFDKLRPPYNVNVLTLAAADLMLENMSILDGQAAALRGERTKLIAQLRATPGVRAFDSAANFVLFRVADADAVFTGLKQRGVLIKNVAAMHPLLAGCLRVTVGTAAENDTFIKALRASLSHP